jgi:peptidoglycan hydrolase CwlO-like protein
MYRTLICAALLLCAGCSDGQSESREDHMQDVAAGAADDATAPLAKRVADLEDQVSELQSQNSDLESKISDLESKQSSEHSWADDNFDTLYNNDQTIAARIGVPVQNPS